MQALGYIVFYSVNKRIEMFAYHRSLRRVVRRSAWTYW